MTLRQLARGTAALAVAALAACSDDTPTAPAADPARAEAARAGAAVPGRYIVVFKNDVSDVPGLARRLTAEHGGTLRHTYAFALKGFAAQLPAAAAEALRRNPNVAYVEPDQVGRAAQATQYSPTWGLDRVDQRSLPPSGTYVYGRTGSGVRVYVVDSGIETGHVEFGGRASVGFDAFAGNGQDCTGHGTHVAGTVGGSTYGVAKSVSLVGVRVFQCSDSTLVSDMVAGVNWVTGYHVKPAVANLSLEAVNSQSLDQAVQNLITAGVTVVAAAGNDTAWVGVDACGISPARVPAAITVGATAGNDSRPGFSNYGSCVDVWAPGHQVLSASILGGTSTKNGTSMAAPHVAGVAAMYLEANPSNTPAGVTSAVLLAATSGRLTGLGTGSPNLLLYSQPASNYRKIGNRWQTGKYIHVESGLQASTIQPGWWSAQWVLEPVAGTQFYRIRNRYTNAYLHAEYGTLQAGSIQSGWHTAQWLLEPVEGHYRIRNRYHNTYLHVEYGSLQLGAIGPHWLSAQWRIEDTEIAA
jgi:subtilisin family serine protease